MNILVRVPNWLGDSVLSLPFFDALQQYFPHSTVDIIAKETVQEIFRHHPAIHTIYPFSKTQVQGVWRLYNYGRTLRAHGPYDLFFSLPSSFSSALIGYGTGSRVRIGYKAEGRAWLLTHSFPQKSGAHRVFTYRNLLAHLHQQRHQRKHAWSRSMRDAQEQEDVQLRFPFSEEERHTTFLNKLPQWKYIVFNVNSEAQSRRLPLEKWSALANMLLQEPSHPVKIVFIGTAGERQRVAEVRRTIRPEAHILDFSGSTSVRELAMLLRDAEVVVSTDSGPMHLANAVGTPLVTCFGAGDLRETGPFNAGNAIVIHKPLPCSPCVKNVCRFSTVRCLEQISVDEIYQRVLQILRKTP